MGLPGMMMPAMLQKITGQPVRIVETISRETGSQFCQHIESYSSVAHGRDDADGCEKDASHNDS